MPQSFRRLASTTASASTKRLADSLLQTATNSPPVVRKQFLDANQTQRLSLGLHRPQLYRGLPVTTDRPPLEGIPLPPAYHLVYFTPAALTDELGSDGTDRSFSPEQPFTRRMWAGGELQWKKANPLRIGEEVTETTRLVSAKAKCTRAGEEMIVTRTEKIFTNTRGLALVDKRDSVFRTELFGAPSTRQYDAMSVEYQGCLPSRPSDESHHSRDFTQTAVSLFRFSALTFNAHKIHYSKPWCRDIEGHRDIVVHGPLNLINILDFWRDVQDDDYAIPRSISYRATAPFYAEERYRALLEKDGDSTSIRLWGSDGKGEVRVGMLGDVVN
ncbi:hypothetical protein MMC21_003167 [Puttea exsequens]|nr:hypothetical protein [Puttea exsequens]